MAHWCKFGALMVEGSHPIASMIYESRSRTRDGVQDVSQLPRFLSRRIHQPGTLGPYHGRDPTVSYIFFNCYTIYAHNPSLKLSGLKYSIHPRRPGESYVHSLAWKGCTSWYPRHSKWYPCMGVRTTYPHPDPKKQHERPSVFLGFSFSRVEAQ